MYEYKKEEGDDGPLFTFDTVYGLTFIVSFRHMGVKDYPLNNLYSLDFVELNQIKSPSDSFISSTILSIVIEFTTEYNDYIIHYLCELSDKKHFYRSRLFSRWFSINNPNGWVKYDIDIDMDLDYKLSFLYDSKIYETNYIEEEIILVLDSLENEKR